MNFSSRLPHGVQTNALTTLLEVKRRAGTRILDLTESNPTRAGIVYPEGFLDALSDPRSVAYEPEPFGLPAARRVDRTGVWGSVPWECGDDGKHERGVLVAVQAAV